MSDVTAEPILCCRIIFDYHKISHIIIGITMVLCAVFGCNNDSRRSKGVSYFRIMSRSDEIQKRWVHFLKRKNYIVTKHSSICSEHFTEYSFLRDLQAELLNLKRQRKLCEAAVPTIYNSSNPSTIPVIVNPPSRKRRAHTESRLQSKHRKDVSYRIHNNMP